MEGGNDNSSVKYVAVVPATMARERSSSIDEEPPKPHSRSDHSSLMVQSRMRYQSGRRPPGRWRTTIIQMALPGRKARMATIRRL